MLRCNSAFALPILEFVLRCGVLLLNAIVSFSSSRCIRWRGFTLIRLSCRCVINVMLLHCVCCTKLIRTLIIVCTVSFHLLLSEFDIPELRLQLINWSSKYQGVDIPIGKVCPVGPDSCVEWPSLHCVWHLNVGWEQSIVGCFHDFFFVFLWHRCLWGCVSNL